MNTKLVSWTLLLNILSVGCGQSEDKREAVETAINSTGKLSQDNSAATAGAFNHVEEVTDAIQDDSNSGGMSLLAGNDITRSKVCSLEADGSAKVVISLSGSGTRTSEKGRSTVEMSMSSTGTETRLWQAPETKTLTCNAANTAARIDWRDASLVDGLKTEVTIDKSRSSSKSITTPKRTFSVSDSSTVKGTRSVSWAVVTSSQALIRTKTIISAVKRSKTSTDKDGKTTTLSSEMSTKVGEPLSVTVERSLSDNSLSKKTINSGTMVSTESDGIRIETTYSSVVFDMSSTNSNRCQPVSGSIAGQIFEVGASSAAKTFLITFGDSAVDSGVSISYDGASAEDYPEYESKGCELESES